MQWRVCVVQLAQCPILPSAKNITISFGLKDSTVNITSVAQEMYILI